MLKLYKQPKKFVLLLISSFLTYSSFANIYTVTNTANSGAGSLAQAITDANTNPGPDEIRFALPTDQPGIIALSTALPAITDAVFINGYSQSGSVQGPIATRVLHVNIDGSAIAGGDIFVISADNVSIAGLAIYRATWYGIKISPTTPFNGPTADNIHIWGNYIGTDTTGTNTGLGNNQGGIVSNLDFGGANTNSDIYIGSNGDGTDDADEGNLVVSSSSAGTTDGDGILLWKSSFSLISGNIVGLNKNGTGTGFGNSRDGIVVTVDANNTTVENNLVGRNAGRGILLAARTGDCFVTGNTIGLDATNTAAPNGTEGLELLNSLNNTIQDNVIGSNTGSGIRLTLTDFFGLFNGPTTGNTIFGNFIGTDAGQTVARGNGGSGILFTSSHTADLNNNIINNNVIANNTMNGITVQAPSGGGSVTGNKFSNNSIYDNTLLGIDLNNDGITINDDGDGDTGPNNLLNAPVITAARVTGGNLVITGFTRPNTVVEFYIADAGPNGSYTKSFGEGQTFLFRAQDDATLGSVTDAATTTGTYDGTDEGTALGGTRTENAFSFSIPVSSLPAAVAAGTRISSIAFENATGAGNTSEFGGVVAAVTVTPVVYTYLKSLLQDGKVQLSWGTGQESNNSRFEVEKSTTGDNFVKIGTVAAKGGSNNQYSFTDAGTLAKVNYYRLKQIDLDARFEYSKVLIVRPDLNGAAVKIGPNPFAGNINVQYQLDKEATVQIRLYDQAGRIARQYTTRGGAGINTYNISDLNSLPRGNYTLEMSGEGILLRKGMIK